MIKILSLIALLIIPQISYAVIEFKQGSVIVDDEIEELLSDWITSLFKVAGLKDHKPKIYLVVNPEINAAATVGGVIMIQSGLIAKCENASQLLGVLAHEVGHIAGGHVSRIDQAATEALIPAGAALILGGALALATGNPSLLAAGIYGGGHVFERGMLKFSRTQESSADQAAMKYLDQLGWGVTGMRDFFKIIDEKMALYAQQLSPYAMSHPMTSERIKAVDDHAKLHPNQTPPAAIEANFQRLRAKVLGFFDDPRSLLQNLGRKKLSAEGQQYAKAIALYRLGRYPEALSELDSLIKSTNSGWYHEMKGQILFDTGKIPESIQCLETASKSRPKAKYLRVMLAHAILESKDPNRAMKAKAILIPITQKDPDNAFAFRLLAIAEGNSNNPGLASLAIAEEAYAKGDIDLTRSKVTQAIKELRKGTPSHQRALDLQHEMKTVGKAPIA
ncbi:MAG: M48 family metalloprotease [Candidatus Paracaedibacteraceae bacterium]|nr:M48 family metalloprotease [Candidatus Paracaedibacteraceae bacterium]